MNRSQLAQLCQQAREAGQDKILLETDRIPAYNNRRMVLIRPYVWGNIIRWGEPDRWPTLVEVKVSAVEKYLAHKGSEPSG